jgi:hypothetical protein
VQKCNDRGLELGVKRNGRTIHEAQIRWIMYFTDVLQTKDQVAHVQVSSPVAVLLLSSSAVSSTVAVVLGSIALYFVGRGTRTRQLFLGLEVCAGLRL